MFNTRELFYQAAGYLISDEEIHTLVQKILNSEAEEGIPFELSEAYVSGILEQRYESLEPDALNKIGSLINLEVATKGRLPHHVPRGELIAWIFGTLCFRAEVTLTGQERGYNEFSSALKLFLSIACQISECAALDFCRHFVAR